MLRTLRDFRKLSVLDQNPRTNITSVERIDYEDVAMGEGAFGKVYPIVNIDSKPQDAYVLKILNKDSSTEQAHLAIEQLYAKIKAALPKHKSYPLHHYAAMLGLPFLAFEALDTSNNEVIIGFVIYNLDQLGYQDFGSDSFDKEAYINQVEFEDRSYLAYQMAKAVSFLHEAQFLHSDISENAVWLSFKHQRLALIDYDGGYHYDDLNQKSSTAGKIGQWASSWWQKNVLGTPNQEISAEERIYEEQWVLASALFEVVFGFPPFIFLKDVEDKTKKSYLRKYTWPEIELDYPDFNSSAQGVYHFVVGNFKELRQVSQDPEEPLSALGALLDAFEQVFNEGYRSKSKRIPAIAWKDILKRVVKELDLPPYIESFELDKSEVHSNEEIITATWKAGRYDALYIQGKLVDIHAKNWYFTVADSEEVELRAVNDFGEARQKIAVKAIKKAPQIVFFEASEELRKSEKPITLSWRTHNTKRIILSPFGKKHPSTAELKVYPKKLTTYKLTAIGNFDERISKILEVDIIRPRITYFDWEVNVEHGINNVDLSWGTEHAKSVFIRPKGGVQQPNGVCHVGLEGRTDLILTARGLFAETTAQLTAAPFPLPKVEHIFTEAPALSLENSLDLAPLEIPNEYTLASGLQVDNRVHFDKEQLKNDALEDSLEMPEFVMTNALLEKYKEEPITLSMIFNKLKKVVYEKLKRKLRKIQKHENP